MTTTATPPLKKVPIHLQSAANRILIKNGTVVNADDEPVSADVYIEVSYTCFTIKYCRILWRIR